MEELSVQLDDLNALSERLYQYIEQEDIRFTRRRLLLLQKLLFIDANANAVARLLMTEPRYLDGATMIMRSMYDLGANVDWILRSRTNQRLWRWLRDDRKTLHDRLKSIIDLRIANPHLDKIGDPLATWQQAFKRVDKELKRGSRLAGVTTGTREESLFQKVKSLGSNAEHLYHMMFWLFSTKTHATPTGLQDLVTMHPLKLQRRTDHLTNPQELEAKMFMRTTLLWYAAHIRQTARYFETPFTHEAQALFDLHMKR